MIDSALSQAASLLQAAMAASKHGKREIDIEGAADRAAKRRKHGEQRIPLRLITFWPDNRGGLGISSYHVHEVAADCKANKTKIKRYGCVDIVEIPSERMEEIKDKCRERSKQDPLMPKFSEDAEYVCMTKTHFTHAQKLAQDGNRFLQNEPGNSICWQADDTEGALILKNGPMCQIYDWQLFEDGPAMDTVGSEDNLNANVQMGEDEMQAFGRVSKHMEDMDVCIQEGDEEVRKIVDIVVKKLQVVGLGQFTWDDWRGFIMLRATLPPTMATVMQTCQFNACTGRVTVKPGDFMRVSTLDPRAPWSKVAMLLWQYIGNMSVKKHLALEQFVGRKEKVAPVLQVDMVKELVIESGFVISVNNFIQSMLLTYVSPTGSGTYGSGMQALTAARGELVAFQGRHMIKVGSALAEATKKSLAIRRPLTPVQRLEIVSAQTIDLFAKSEKIFRKKLVTDKLFTEDDLPPVVNVLEIDAVKTVAAPSQATSSGVKQEPSSSEIYRQPLTTDLGKAPDLTAAHVLGRLNIKGVGERVLAFIKSDSGSDVKHEVSEDEHDGLVHIEGSQKPVGLDECSDSSKPSVSGDWFDVLLRQLCMPDAVIELDEAAGGQTMTVSVDDLRPLNSPPPPPGPTHPSMITDGTTLDAYNYQSMQSLVAINVAQHMLLSLHGRSILSVEKLSVHQLSEGAKAPLILQVRAKETIKKGMLVLAPAYGEVVAQDLQINYHGSFFSYYNIFLGSS